MVKNIKELRETVKAERAKRSLWRFLRDYAWPVLQPGSPFVDNWHIHAICEHLEAVSRGEISRLMINMPFRMLKSTIISQTWPVWEWITKPHIMYMTASYAMDVATRDAVDSRRIIESPEFQAAFGDSFKMTGDQNVKTRYENDKRGARVVTATDAKGTGFGGNRITIDDPISSKDANSDTARKTSIDWYKGTASTRLNNPKDDAIVLTHQRLHVQDLTGYILKEEGEETWERLILPMRFDRRYNIPTSIGWSDPRTVDDELMFPERLPEATVQRMEKTLGAYHTAAQLQQRPTTRGGSVLKSEWFPRYKTLPRFVRKRMYGDTAQKTKEVNDYSVFQVWGLGDDGKIYLVDQIRGKWEALELENKCIAFWNKHVVPEQFTAQLSKLLIEDKSSGTGLIQTIRSKGSIPVLGVPRTKDKVTRIYDGQGFMESGLVVLPETAYYLSDLTGEIDEFSLDDSHRFDDQLDPMLDAIADLLMKPKSIYDVL